VTERTSHQETLEALKDLGMPGQRAAEWFGCGFDQAKLDGVRAGNFVAYCGREALMSLLELGGERSRDLTDAVDAVIDVSSGVDDQDPVLSELSAAIKQLGVVRSGPGPHARRLERLITEIAQRKPARAEADLFDRFARCLGELNGLTHSAVPADKKEARVQLNLAFEITRRMFAPISSRLDAIDSLIALTAPSSDDVDQLLGWNGDPRMLSYFFLRVKGPAWFVALSKCDVLVPPKDVGLWPALPYLAGLGATHPGELREWMRAQHPDRDLTSQQALHYIQLARSVVVPVDAELWPTVKNHLQHPSIISLLDAYLMVEREEEADQVARSKIIKTALQGLIDNDRFPGRGFHAGSLLRTVLREAKRNEPERWLNVMCAKTRDMLGNNTSLSAWRIRQIPSIASLHSDNSDHLVDQFVATIRELMRLAEASGVSDELRLAPVRRLPSPLSGRLLAVNLTSRPKIDEEVAVTFLRTEVAAADPMPETLALLSQLCALSAPGLEQALTHALGHPPTAEERGQFDDNDELPDDWVRAYSWSPALPLRVLEPWSAAVDICKARWGAPQAMDLIMPRAFAVNRQQESPYVLDDLKTLTALEASETIAAWKPTTSDPFGPHRFGLAQTLKQLVSQNATVWLSPDSANIVRSLSSTDYISGYFQGISDAKIETLPDSFIDAVEAASQLSALSKVRTDGVPEEMPWTAVWSTALPLLMRLDTEHLLTRTRIWALLEALLDPREQTEPHHPSTCAAVMGAVVGFADATMSDAPPDQLLTILERALSFTGSSGRSVRSVIGANLSWLVHRANSWTDANWRLLVGDDAPEQLGDITFQEYLDRGRPHAPLLTRCPAEIWAAHDAGRESALRHILCGMLWRIDGYQPSEVLDGLLETSAGESVSNAAEWLARALAGSESLDIAPVLAFWEEATRRELSSSEYSGFGEFATVEAFDPDLWLRLTLQAATRCPTGLSFPSQIATRASQFPNNIRALRLISALLESRLELWSVYDIGTTGVKMLEETTVREQTVRDELRERLLEREFFEVRPEPVG
jgi:hypothetical protein